MSQKNKKSISPRIRVIQKLYSSSINPEETIIYPKSQFKKFIKDVVKGTIERNEFIEETVNKHLSEDLDLKRTDILLKTILYMIIKRLKSRCIYLEKRTNIISNLS